jgi:hypothetical protein
MLKKFTALLLQFDEMEFFLKFNVYTTNFRPMVFSPKQLAHAPQDIH